MAKYDLKERVLMPGVKLQYGRLAIDAVPDRGNICEITVEPGGDFRVALNGKSAISPKDITSSVVYMGGPEGGDTFRLDASLNFIGHFYKDNNTIDGGPGIYNVAYLHGDDNTYNCKPGSSNYVTDFGQDNVINENQAKVLKVTTA